MLRKKVKNVPIFSDCLFQASQFFRSFDFFRLLSACKSFITDFLSKNWQYSKKHLPFLYFLWFFKVFPVLSWNYIKINCVTKDSIIRKLFWMNYCCETVNILLCSILTEFLTGTHWSKMGNFQRKLFLMI